MRRLRNRRANAHIRLAQEHHETPAVLAEAQDVALEACPPAQLGPSVRSSCRRRRLAPVTYSPRVTAFLGKNYHNDLWARSAIGKLTSSCRSQKSATLHGCRQQSPSHACTDTRAQSAIEMRGLARGGSTTDQAIIIKVDVSESVARVEDNEGPRARVAEFEGLLSATTTQLAVVIAERDNLRRAYDPLKEHWELLQRRIFVAKAGYCGCGLVSEVEFSNHPCNAGLAPSFWGAPQFVDSCSPQVGILQCLAPSARVSYCQ